MCRRTTLTVDHTATLPRSGYCFQRLTLRKYHPSPLVRLVRSYRIQLLYLGEGVAAELGVLLVLLFSFVLRTRKLALLAGFEPATHALEERCSIHLSYNSIKCYNEIIILLVIIEFNRFDVINDFPGSRYYCPVGLSTTLCKLRSS